MLIKNNEHTLIHIKIMCVRQINYLMLHENITISRALYDINSFHAHL